MKNALLPNNYYSEEIAMRKEANQKSEKVLAFLEKLLKNRLQCTGDSCYNNRCDIRTVLC